MSITSSDDTPTNSDFSNLLVRYPSLATWLTDVLRSEEKLQAEAFLPVFLTQCASQGIAESAYPFAAQDQGLADLGAFLQQGEAGIEAIVARLTVHVPAVPFSALPRDVRKNKTPKPKHSLARTPRKFIYSTANVEEPTEKRAAIKLPAPAPTREDVAPVVNEASHESEVVDVQSPESTETVVASELEAANFVEASAELTEERMDLAELRTIPALAAVSAGTEDAAVVEPVAGSESAEKPEASAELTAEGRDLAELRTIPALAAVPTDTLESIPAQQPAPPANPLEVPGGSSSQQVSRKRKTRTRRPRSRRQRIVVWVCLLMILGAILVPAGFLLNFGMSAYNTYHQLGDEARTAVSHLLNVKTIFSSGGKTHLQEILDVSKVQQAQKEFLASEQAFQQLQNQLQHSATIATVTTYLPQYRSVVQSAQAASAIGIDVSQIGQIAAEHVLQLDPSFSGPLLSASSKPLITQPMLDTISATIVQVMPLLNDIQSHTQNLDLASLPISASEKTQIGQLLPLLPQAISDLGQVHDLLGSAGWLLGVDQPRTFLIQTMDRAELRSTGGFTGQYGELSVSGGRIGAFSLKDIAAVEYAATSVTQGQSAPSQYSSWWPFPNWGLRDSNVSADFPTTAQLAINLYKNETGDQVDGVISFTPVVIEHILNIIGPITVPSYNTMVNANNLEDVLHYYQLNNNGILAQINQTGGSGTQVRKAFTSLLAEILMQKVRAAPPDELLSIAHSVLNDLKTKDLQVYFTNPAAENVLMQYGYAGQLNRSQNHDGLFVVQENLSASKASQYVQTIMHDTVTLNAQGGATHVLQLRLVYNQAGPVYGYDTYYDYVRVYVPANSKLLSGDGFSSGTPLCGGTYGACPEEDVYPGNELTCPSGQYQPGATPPNNTGSDGGTWEPLQTLSGPTNTTSDEAGRAMYGGWVIVPKNCVMNVTLSWYVPPQSQQPYSLLVQRQSGTFPELDLTIQPSAAACAKLKINGLHFDHTLTEDTSFTPRASSDPDAQSCVSQEGA